MIIKNFIILGAAFLILFLISEFIYYTFKPRAEATRKFVHIGTGLLTLFFPIFLDSQWQVFILCTIFLFILIFSRKFNFLLSINNIERKSYGSIVYPIIVSLVFLLYIHVSNARNYKALEFFYIPILIMAISDPMAAIMGRYYPIMKWFKPFQKKSLGGTLAFLISAFMISICIFLVLQIIPFSFKLILIGVLISLLTALVELLSDDGLDNFTIPLTAFITLYFLL